MTPPLRALVIVEADPRGHHLYYVRLLVDAARHMNRQAVFWTTAAVAATDEFRVHLGDLDSEHVTAVALTPKSHDTARRRLVQMALDAHPDATLALPHADRMLFALWWLTRRLADGRILLMRSPMSAGATLPQRGRHALKRLALRLLHSRGLVRVAVLGLPHSPADGQLLVAGARLPVIPDPPLVPPLLPSADALRTRLRLPSEFLFLLAGRLDTRKGIPETLDAWRRRRTASGYLVLVGSVAEEVRETIRSAMSRDDRIVLREGYLSDEDFMAYLACVDVVITAYHNTGPSGVYAAATAVGTPVIAAGNDDLVAAVLAAGSGLVCSLDPDSMAVAMDDAARNRLPVRSAEPAQLDAQRARFTDFFAGA